MRKTIGTLHAQTCAKDKLIVCLATESRDHEAPEKVKTLMSEFGDGLLGFFYTTHVLAEGEAVGKSSNTAWAVRCIKHTLVDTWGFVPEDVLLTICDADTYFDSQFMDCLAYHHAQDPTPYNTTYQAVECFSPIFGLSRLSFASRLLSILSVSSDSFLVRSATRSFCHIQSITTDSS